MFQATGDLRFLDEPTTMTRIVSVFGLDFLEGDFAMQFLIKRDKYLAKSAASMWSKDAETRLRSRSGRALTVPWGSTMLARVA